MALYAPKFKAQKRLHLPPLKSIGNSLYNGVTVVEATPPPPPPETMGLTTNYDFTQSSNIEEL